jgi:hypothetical protein
MMSLRAERSNLKIIMQQILKGYLRLLHALGVRNDIVGNYALES